MLIRIPMDASQLKNNLTLKFSEKILKWEEKNPRRLYAGIDPGSLREIAGYIFHELKARFATAAAVQTLAGFQILYHFSLDRSGVILSLRVKLGKKDPEVDSITEIVPAADWIEREMGELFGIRFRGRPDLRRLLLSEDWPEGVYPLRKNFGEEGNRVKE